MYKKKVGVPLIVVFPNKVLELRVAHSQRQNLGSSLCFFFPFTFSLDFWPPLSPSISLSLSLSHTHTHTHTQTHTQPPLSQQNKAMYFLLLGTELDCWPIAITGLKGSSDRFALWRLDSCLLLDYTVGGNSVSVLWEKKISWRLSLLCIWNPVIQSQFVRFEWHFTAAEQSSEGSEQRVFKFNTKMVQMECSSRE